VAYIQEGHGETSGGGMLLEPLIQLTHRHLTLFPTTFFLVEKPIEPSVNTQYWLKTFPGEGKHLLCAGMVYYTHLRSR
jgi:hypothetical protein